MGLAPAPAQVEKLEHENEKKKRINVICAVMELNHHDVLQHQQKVSLARRDSKAGMARSKIRPPCLATL